LFEFIFALAIKGIYSIINGYFFTFDSKILTTGKGRTCTRYVIACRDVDIAIDGTDGTAYFG